MRLHASSQEAPHEGYTSLTEPAQPQRRLTEPQKQLCMSIVLTSKFSLGDICNVSILLDPSNMCASPTSQLDY